MVGSLVPCPRCAVQRGQNVLHLRILVYSMLVRTIINDRDLLTLVKNRHTQLAFYISFLVFWISFKVGRKRGYLYARRYNDTIVFGVPDKLGKTLCIKSGVTLIPIHLSFPLCHQSKDIIGIGPGLEMNSL